MAKLATYDDLAGLEPGYLAALLDREGAPAWQATYRHRWERDSETWRAVERALTLATRPRALRPRLQPRDSPPPFLAALVRHRLKALSEQSWQRGFERVRLLERLGLAAPEHDDT
jgi:hypothetical protein